MDPLTTPFSQPKSDTKTPVSSTPASASSPSTNQPISPASTINTTPVTPPTPITPFKPVIKEESKPISPVAPVTVATPHSQPLIKVDTLTQHMPSSPVVASIPKSPFVPSSTLPKTDTPPMSMPSTPHLQTVQIPDEKASAIHNVPTTTPVSSQVHTTPQPQPQIHAIPTVPVTPVTTTQAPAATPFTHPIPPSATGIHVVTPQVHETPKPVEKAPEPQLAAPAHENLQATIVAPNLGKTGTTGVHGFIAPKNKGGISPVIIILGIIVFILAYTVFWVKFFNVSIPFLGM